MKLVSMLTLLIYEMILIYQCLKKENSLAEEIALCFIPIAAAMIMAFI